MCYGYVRRKILALPNTSGFLNNDRELKSDKKIFLFISEYLLFLNLIKLYTDY